MIIAYSMMVVYQDWLTRNLDAPLKTLGDRMKSYEKAVDYTVADNSWIVVRLDLRCGGKFVKHHRYTPFDTCFSHAMAKTMKELVDEFSCVIGYTQSDEISLVFPCLEENQTRFFGGRVQKWTSVMASSASVRFARHTSTDLVPQFDARIIELPSPEEAYNCLLFRARDCRRNSITMHARQFFSAKQLLHKKCDDMLEMCSENPWDLRPKQDRFGWWYKPCQGLTTFEMSGFDFDIFKWMTEKDSVLATDSLDILIAPKPTRQRTDSVEKKLPVAINPMDTIRNAIKDLDLDTKLLIVDEITGIKQTISKLTIIGPITGNGRSLAKSIVEFLEIYNRYVRHIINTQGDEIIFDHYQGDHLTITLE